MFSSLVHGAVLWTLFLIPQIPLMRTAPAYPVYSVELVGGEKIGGMSLGSRVEPPPVVQKEPQKPKAEEPRPQIRKSVQKSREKAKAKERVVKIPEKPAAKRSKREEKREVQERKPEPREETKATKEETKAPPEAKGLSSEVREKLIQAAVERLKARAEPKQKTKDDGLTTGTGEGEGAAALGAGGRGGGIVKPIEFLLYRNTMLRVIRDRWTWVGKRTDLEVTVHFGIQENGSIVGLKILRPSGDASYDDSVIRAVTRASPLPPPPENYRKEFEDVELTFRPKDLGG